MEYSYEHEMLFVNSITPRIQSLYDYEFTYISSDDVYDIYRDAFVNFVQSNIYTLEELEDAFIEIVESHIS